MYILSNITWWKFKRKKILKWCISGECKYIGRIQILYKIKYYYKTHLATCIRILLIQGVTKKPVIILRTYSRGKIKAILLYYEQYENVSGNAAPYLHARKLKRASSPSVNLLHPVCVYGSYTINNTYKYILYYAYNKSWHFFFSASF